MQDTNKVRELNGVIHRDATNYYSAKELDIQYASIAIVTIYAAGLLSSVSAEEDIKIFADKIESL